MKITREEFKELKELYNELWDIHAEYAEYINESVLDELLFPMMDWIEEKLGFQDLFYDMFRGPFGVPINWEETDDSDEIDISKMSSNLDVIYDKYLAEV